MSHPRFQVIVIGSGFGGSLMAMVSQRLGFSTALIERGRHPRFAIGESSTPFANLLLEEVANTYDLPAVRPLCKWGSWQEKLPQLGCGLKRGFTFYQHRFGERFESDLQRRRQLLVGASPNETIADTHWYRPDFDSYLVETARALGVAYLDEVEISKLSDADNRITLQGSRRGEPMKFSADFLIDASGPRGFLHQALKLSEVSLPLLPPTQALFTHFTNVAPLPESFDVPGKIPPYPPEQAAVHHIFPGGWIWVLKFNNGITSAGVAATDKTAGAFGFESGVAAWTKLLEQLPSLAEIFEPATATRPFIHQPRLAFQSAQATGPRWALLPSAAGFVDPLLSTGFPLTLLGVTRLGRLLSDHWNRSSFAAELKTYSDLTMLELQSTARLVAALYASMDRFEVFKQLSLLYFAAAHYSETMWRSGRKALANSFLLSHHAEFSKSLREICESAARGSTDISGRILSAIQPFDLAGLTDPKRGPWYSALGFD